MRTVRRNERKLVMWFVSNLQNQAGSRRRQFHLFRLQTLHSNNKLRKNQRQRSKKRSSRVSTGLGGTAILCVFIVSFGGLTLSLVEDYFDFNIVDLLREHIDERCQHEELIDIADCFKNKKQWESTVQQLLGHVLGYLNMPFIRLCFSDCKESREVGPHFWFRSKRGFTGRPIRGTGAPSTVSTLQRYEQNESIV